MKLKNIFIQRKFIATGLTLVVFGAAILAPLIMKTPGGKPPCGWKTQNVISTVSLALEHYKLDNYAYPTDSQGLQALVKKPVSHPAPENWRDGGYLLIFPTDSWGRDILYSSNANGYEVMSLGRDGKLGGQNCDKDITQ